MTDHLEAGTNKVQEWISVEERLPEVGHIVMTYGEAKIIYFSWLAEGNLWLCEQSGSDHVLVPVGDQRITHWRELPAAPGAQPLPAPTEEKCQKCGFAVCMCPKNPFADEPLPAPTPSANTTTLAPCGVQDHADKAQIVGGHAAEPLPAPMNKITLKAALEYLSSTNNDDFVRISLGQFDALGCGETGRKSLAAMMVNFANRAEPLPAVSQDLPGMNSLTSGAVSPTPNWKSVPDEQTWWWHWNGDDYAVPHIYSVRVGKTGPDRYFVADGKRAPWCDEMGGFWLKVEYPNVPTRDEQKLIASGYIAGPTAPQNHPSCTLCGALMSIREFECLSCGSRSGCVSPEPQIDELERLVKQLRYESQSYLQELKRIQSLAQGDWKERIAAVRKTVEIARAAYPHSDKWLNMYADDVEDMLKLIDSMIWPKADGAVSPGPITEKEK